MGVRVEGDVNDEGVSSAAESTLGETTRAA